MTDMARRVASVTVSMKDGQQHGPLTADDLAIAGKNVVVLLAGETVRSYFREDVAKIAVVGKHWQGPRAGSGFPVVLVFLEP